MDLKSAGEIELSIIIVNWNARKYLAQCIDSILGEMCGLKVEIIVVDNASTDGSREMLEREYPKVRLLCNETNLGFARANNRGIDASGGRYICLVNSDVIVHENCLRTMLAYMEAHPDRGVIGPKAFNGNGTLQYTTFSCPTVMNTVFRAFGLDTMFPRSALFGRRLMKFWPHDRVRDVEALSGCFLFVRRTAMDMVGKLDERFFIYGEDLDWCKRFNDGGWKVTFFPGAHITHFGGASSSNAPKRFYLEMRKADLQYWKKHMGSHSKVVFILIAFTHELLHLMSYIGTSTLKKDVPFLNIKIDRSVACLKWLIARAPFE